MPKNKKKKKEDTVYDYEGLFLTAGRYAEELEKKLITAAESLEKKDKQYKWLKNHYDRRGDHLAAYLDAIKILVPTKEHYKLSSFSFAKELLKRFEAFIQIKTS